jgi:hypothetical protein
VQAREASRYCVLKSGTPRWFAPSVSQPPSFIPTMSPDTLLADPETIRLDSIRPGQGVIKLVVHTTAKGAICPGCHRVSSRAHSHYIRTATDLPWLGVLVKT